MLARYRRYTFPSPKKLTDVETRKALQYTTLLYQAVQKDGLYRAMAATAGQGFKEEKTTLEAQRLWRGYWARKTFLKRNAQTKTTPSQVKPTA